MSSSSGVEVPSGDVFVCDSECDYCDAMADATVSEECSQSLLESVVVEDTQSSTASLICSSPPSYVQAVMSAANSTGSGPPAYEEIFRSSDEGLRISDADASSIICDRDDYGAYAQLLRSWGCVAMIIISVIVLLTLMALTLSTALSFRRQ